jgi:hypothetical protein
MHRIVTVIFFKLTHGAGNIFAQRAVTFYMNHRYESKPLWQKSIVQLPFFFVTNLNPQKG